MTNFAIDLDAVRVRAEARGIKWDNDLFYAAFGTGTYRWLINALGIGYSDGMDIGLFDLHQNYNREDLEGIEQ